MTVQVTAVMRTSSLSISTAPLCFLALRQRLHVPRGHCRGQALEEGQGKQQDQAAPRLSLLLCARHPSAFHQFTWLKTPEHMQQCHICGRGLPGDRCVDRSESRACWKTRVLAEGSELPASKEVM